MQPPKNTFEIGIFFRDVAQSALPGQKFEKYTICGLVLQNSSNRNYIIFTQNMSGNGFAYIFLNLS